jgi:hypothetical protein
MSGESFVRVSGKLFGINVKYLEGKLKQWGEEFNPLHIYIVSIQQGDVHTIVTVSYSEGQYKGARNLTKKHYQPENFEGLVNQWTLVN